MNAIQRFLWGGTVGGTVVLLAGLAIALIDAAAHGGWYQAREPWIGVALWLIVLGLLVTNVAGTAWVLLAAPWWVKLLILVPAAVAALWWITMFTVGMATTGFGGSERDVRTIIYSVPEFAMLFVGLPTLAIVALAVVSRRGRPSRASATAE